VTLPAPFVSFVWIVPSIHQSIIMTTVKKEVDMDAVREETILEQRFNRETELRDQLQVRRKRAGRERGKKKGPPPTTGC
jgi:hypothetical protein